MVPPWMCKALGEYQPHSTGSVRLVNELFFYFSLYKVLFFGVGIAYLVLFICDIFVLSQIKNYTLSYFIQYIHNNYSTVLT